MKVHVVVVAAVIPVIPVSRVTAVATFTSPGDRHTQLLCSCANTYTPTSQTGKIKTLA